MQSPSRTFERPGDCSFGVGIATMAHALLLHRKVVVPESPGGVDNRRAAHARLTAAGHTGYNLRMTSRRTRYLISRKAKIIFALLCSTLVGCGLGELDNYAPLTVTDNFHAIVEGVAYRSAQLDATSLNLVFERYGVRTVINLRGENEDLPWYDNERTAAEQAGVRLVDIRMSASTLPSRENLLLLFDTFQTAEYPILIHCQAGSDRTGAAAAIWRMQIRGDTREAATAELSLAYGHFEPVHPEMDELVRIFQPERAWIESEYPG